MRPTACKLLLMKLIKRDIWEKMPVDLDMIMISMSVVELEPIFVEKKLG